MTQYRCKYFVIKELVNPTLLKKIGEELAWQLFDDRLLKCADMIREKYGACTVNANGLVDCGLRDPQSNTGAKYSAHKFGRALDLHIRSIELQCAGKKETKSAQYNRIRKQLMLDSDFNILSFEQNSKEYPNGITWLHISVENRKKRLFNA